MVRAKFPPLNLQVTILQNYRWHHFLDYKSQTLKHTQGIFTRHLPTHLTEQTALIGRLCRSRAKAQTPIRAGNALNCPRHFCQIFQRWSIYLPFLPYTLAYTKSLTFSYSGGEKALVVTFNDQF